MKLIRDILTRMETVHTICVIWGWKELQVTKGGYCYSCTRKKGINFILFYFVEVRLCRGAKHVNTREKSKENYLLGLQQKHPANDANSHQLERFPLVSQQVVVK